MNPLDDLILLSILDSLRNIFYVFLKQHKVDSSSSKLFSLCFMAQLNPSILIGPFIVYTTVYPSTIYCHLLYIQIQFCLFKPTVKININTQHLAYKPTLNIFGSSINQIQIDLKRTQCSYDHKIFSLKVSVLCFCDESSNFYSLVNVVVNDST